MFYKYLHSIATARFKDTMKHQDLQQLQAVIDLPLHHPGYITSTASLIFFLNTTIVIEHYNNINSRNNQI